MSHLHNNYRVVFTALKTAIWHLQINIVKGEEVRLLRTLPIAKYLHWQSAKFQMRLIYHFRGDQMLMKDNTVQSVQWSMPINFQGGDN